MSEREQQYAIDELATLAGTTRRTVRFYVQLGLLPAPRGLGRGKHYSNEHLQRLRRIRELQEAGVPLALIRSQLAQLADVAPELAGKERDSAAGMQPSTWSARSVAAESAAQARDSAHRVSVWTHVPLGDGVVLQLRDRPLTESQRKAIADALAAILQRSEDDE